ncbi:MAG: hypothetical protein WDO69_35025 [Pseudomonadota bacterium]
MSRKSTVAHEFEHPLFRALVLMGGSMALGCGGSAVIDQGTGGSNSAQGGAPAQGGALAQGGLIGVSGSPSIAGAAQGGGGASAFDAGLDDCPPAQWDCSALGPSCEPSLGSGGRPAGCVCDPKRPRSVADCSAKQELVCLRAYASEPDPDSWDTSVHVQCSCVAGPYVPDSSTCSTTCSETFGTPTGAHTSCSLPSGMTCDSSGNNCTATSADVLRQDGIVCGCAPVILK